MTRAHVSLLAAACLAGCTPSGPAAKATIRRERLVQARSAPFDSVTVTRAPGALRVHLTTTKRCQIDVKRATDVVFADGHVERGELLLESSEQAACDPVSEPAADVDIGVLAGDRLRLLGTTSQQGDLEIRLNDLDALFGDRPVAMSQLGQLIVRGEKAAELPLGEILNRQREVDTRVAACEAALAEHAGHDTLARRLAELSDLQLQGAVDPRLTQCADRLYARISESSADASAPASWLDRAKTMVSDLFNTGDHQDVPAAVQHDLDDKQVDSSTFSWAISMLPTMCKVTVNGGAAAVGQLVATGPAGIALSIVMSVLGDDLSDWLSNRCCEMAAGSLTDAQSTVCHTEPRKL
jgi:prepilin-type processing-associated H-X9-DG protein